jgi:hypothetical protein
VSGLNRLFCLFSINLGHFFKDLNKKNFQSDYSHLCNMATHVICSFSERASPYLLFTIFLLLFPWCTKLSWDTRGKVRKDSRANRKKGGKGRRQR